MSWCLRSNLLDQQNKIQQDLMISGHASPESTTTSPTADTMKTLGHPRLYDVQEKKDGDISDKREKRNMHREIERQRRQDMAKLYASLRSLLPLECIKGKRAVSDHMHEAVNYIKHLEKNIKELEIKRNKLQKLTNSSCLEGKRNNSDNCLANFVTFNLCSSGMEILINSGFREEGFRLSKVLEVLLQEGLNVLTYTSTNMNGMLLYMIKLEVCDPATVDLKGLQEKLTAIVTDNYV